MPTYYSNHPDWERLSVYGVIRAGMVLSVHSTEEKASEEAQKVREGLFNFKRLVTVRGFYLARCQAQYFARRVPIEFKEYEIEALHHDEVEEAHKQESQQPVWNHP